MAQGSGKLKSKGTSVGAERKKAGRTKVGKREVAPKTKERIAAKSHQKKLSTQINHSIEKQMVQAASSGKLTIMKNKGGDKLEAGKGKGKVSQ